MLALDGGTDGWARSGRPLETGPGRLLSPEVDVYRRPYEGTDAGPAVMQAYLDWEHGLVAQLERDGTHGFTVLTSTRWSMPTVGCPLHSRMGYRDHENCF